MSDIVVYLEREDDWYLLWDNSLISGENLGDYDDPFYVGTYASDSICDFSAPADDDYFEPYYCDEEDGPETCGEDYEGGCKTELSLFDLIGTNADGDWTIHIFDSSEEDEGILRSVYLGIYYGGKRCGDRIVMYDEECDDGGH